MGKRSETTRGVGRAKSKITAQVPDSRILSQKKRIKCFIRMSFGYEFCGSWKARGWCSSLKSKLHAKKCTYSYPKETRAAQQQFAVKIKGTLIKAISISLSFFFFFCII